MGSAPPLLVVVCCLQLSSVAAYLWWMDVCCAGLPLVGDGTVSGVCACVPVRVSLCACGVGGPAVRCVSLVCDVSRLGCWLLGSCMALACLLVRGQPMGRHSVCMCSYNNTMSLKFRFRVSFLLYLSEVEIWSNEKPVKTRKKCDTLLRLRVASARPCGHGDARRSSWSSSGAA